ncbi:nucleoside-binding protein [Sporobacter termitidis DSM 10068]|uniref:Nucleoside-binding protein n=1 Tax=Sporobacter termitidis DSM 10068 TaxID=1123282 RepID=A0A1M5YY69_9FIRM|nr:nucleoside-binding protein [Sporobacter termitidis DSM 10068]
MKKILALTLALVMMIALAACGSSTPGTPSSPSAEATASASPSAPATAGIPKDKLKIGFIHIADPNDKGYTFNHDLGTQKMAENLGLSKDQIINKYNIPEDDKCATAINELIEAGCNAIFATSFGHGDYMLEAAKEHPDIQFFHATGAAAASSGLSNFHNYFTSIYEARYLGGIAAGLKLNELGATKLGYVGAYPYAEVISGFTAFYLGAKSVCPDVTMDVIYTTSWHDPVKEAQVAKTLIDGGCKVISQHSDSTAPATTAEDNGVFQVGYNADMSEAAPNASLISARSDWSVYLTYAVQSIIDGKQIPADWCQGLAEGAVFLSPLNTKIAAPGTQDAIDKAIAEIKAGTLHVFAGPLTGSGVDFDNKTVTVDVKAGDWFHESETQSAPYWNYIIPGVNVID